MTFKFKDWTLEKLGEEICKPLLIVVLTASLLIALPYALLFRIALPALQAKIDQRVQEQVEKIELGMELERNAELEAQRNRDFQELARQLAVEIGNSLAAQQK